MRTLLRKQIRKDGREEDEMHWSIRTLPASGFGVADGVVNGQLDNDLFDFVPETQAEALNRFWKSQ